MAHLVKQDFFRNGYFVKEELRQDDEGAMKEYWFARWFRDDRLVAEVSICIRIGIMHSTEIPALFLVYTPQWESGRVWRMDTGSAGPVSLSFDHNSPALPRYVMDWLEEHAAALHHWRWFMIQYHK